MKNKYDIFNSHDYISKLIQPEPTSIKINQTFGSRYVHKCSDGSELIINFIGGILRTRECNMPKRIMLELEYSSTLLLEIESIEKGKKTFFSLLFVFPSLFPCIKDDRKAKDAFSIFHERLSDISSLEYIVPLVADRSLSADDFNFYGVPYKELSAKFDVLSTKCNRICDIYKMRTE
jgi:hypothetical protein